MDKALHARQLADSRGFGCLSTLSARHPGFPFASIAEFATDEEGQPVFLFSGLAIHTKNLAADPRASLIVFAADAEQDTLSAARLTLMGNVQRLDDDAPGTAAVRDRYLARHPQAAQWVDFGDFAFYRLEVSDVYWVGGFGQMGWVSPMEFRSLASAKAAPQA